MALFSKPPVKKPVPKPEVKVRPVAPGARPASARDLVSEASLRGEAARPGAPQDEPTTTNAKVVAMRSAKTGIEIQDAGNGLCAALENAALMFASGQAKPARDLLEESVSDDPEARALPFTWLCLFDLLRRAHDRAAFERAALQYVVQFEKSAPGWEELGGPSSSTRANAGSGTIVLNGTVSAASLGQLDALKRPSGSERAEVRVDLGAVSDYDDEGARALAERLGDARRRGVPLVVVRSEKLRQKLERAVNEGREAGQGAWLLLLELLQWLGEHAAFDDRAVEYAVTFEMSPPSWEPAPPNRQSAGAAPPSARGATVDAETLQWSETITGATSPRVKELQTFAESRSNVVIDMTLVERVDFASAGALANAIQRMLTQKKSIQIVGLSPIIRALMLLVGVRADLFPRKPA